MVRAPVTGVLVGAVIVVLAQWGPVASAAGDVPLVTCAGATLRTIDQRIEHLVEVVEAVERGVSPRSLPAAPTDPALGACGVQ
ncbi:hypothetical protein [Nocardioides daphniae]|uniref:Uncharacterized protein n=1 Tax=Nocardioides daphniae TaxID=402297 RepID=A0A4P7UCW7_9ACTN|nr:hypothetical protein [Nocardioides daphniae]QCC78082.1 hypothetical protein E2C04_14435 [Nocardioides daphniae]